MCSNSGPNVGRADIQGGHEESPESRFMRNFQIKFGSSPRRTSASSYANYSKLQNLLPVMPTWQRLRLVFAQNQKELGRRPQRLELTQSIRCVARADALDFSRIDHHVGQLSKCQLRHGQAVRRWAQSPRLVPGFAGRHHTQFIKLQLGQCRLDQRHMGHMRGVKRTAKDTDAPHLKPNPGAPESGCTTLPPANPLRARSDTTSSPAAASTAKWIQCARPTAGQSACHGPTPG